MPKSAVIGLVRLLVEAAVQQVRSGESRADKEMPTVAHDAPHESEETPDGSDCSKTAYEVIKSKSTRVNNKKAAS